ncbi:substrate-binding periplasmic protein [Megalodesulfovibrio gigas]|nr:transporter substrate-binding domain-containing protein [Megalodesulfovibrio gigas]
MALPRSWILGILLCTAGLTACLWWMDGDTLRMALSANASPRVVRLVSLEWPPYVGEQLPGQGASAMVLRKALAAAGLELHIEFMPWARVLETVRADTSYLGYFPEYYTEAQEDLFLFSQPMGASVLAFAEQRARPVPWARLEQLAPYRVGVVQGYVNSREFDALVAANVLQTEPVVDDRTNLRKLASGRLRLAVIDVMVFNYLLALDPSLTPLAGTLRLQEQRLEEKTLHVCLRKGPAGEAVLRALNSALAGLDIHAEQAAALAAMTPSSSSH